MSAPCVCATCTALRQSGNTPVYAPTNPTVINGLGPFPTYTTGLPPSQRSIVYLGHHQHARVKWIPTQASLLNTKWKKLKSEDPNINLSTFPNFPRLPTELRIRIWAFSTSDSRVLELRTWKSDGLSPLKISAGPHAVPPVLHTNRESRIEGLRIYQLEEIGRSVWRHYDSDREYIPWRYHPANPFPDPDYQVKSSRSAPRDIEPVMPYATQRVYIDYTRDTIYLGPEFSIDYIKGFLASPEPFLELPRLRYLALDRKLWLRGHGGTWDTLRTALYTLRKRPVMEVYIVPDDERNALVDRWYYGKHELLLKESAFSYTFIPADQSEPAKTAVENLQEWFDRLWTSRLPATNFDNAKGVPRVSIKSARRAGHQISDWKDGVWEVQKNLGDMRRWKLWMPSDDEIDGG
ncbi:hypothetical protein BJ875DRAFT_480784 [Amylocarpus encephaloides]|uniref:2EXR domain-containing protein n=1 Tax=Amylocarpus encephaloides TaxID=45428 RepID=A0A9P8C8P8_9HELO|nr:hypothetical protein BJ875DRAFT_480784 [Amylocarpus encephaloides]